MAAVLVAADAEAWKRRSRDRRKLSGHERKFAFVADWDSRGDGDGGFAKSYGIATDSQRDTYGADSGRHRVQRFTEV